MSAAETSGAEQAPEVGSRTYCVGLPVTVTVYDDGRVEYDVDTAEAGAAIREDPVSARGLDPDDPEWADLDPEEIIVEGNEDAERCDRDHETAMYGAPVRRVETVVDTL